MWLLILVVYFAPPDSVDWNGPFELGLARISEEHFTTEELCLNRGKEIKAELGNGMLAPVRYQCLMFPKHQFK